MQLAALTCFLCIFGASAGTDSHPIEKVIDLLKELKATAIQEGQAEEVSYTKFEYWCSTSIAELKDAIKDEKETIDELTDKIAGLTKEKEALEKEIAALEEQIAKLEASGKKAADDRAAEAALYAKAHADVESTIKAIEDCIVALQEAATTTEADNPTMLMAKRKMKMVLGLISLKVSSTQRQILQAFASAEPELEAEGDLAKHTDKYDFKSDNVIELLKNLKLKFEDDMLAGTKAETNALNAYDLSKQARDNAIKAAKDSKEEKETTLAATEKSIADAEKEKKSTEEDLAADSQTLEETENACRMKKTEWEQRSETRKNEIEAMDQAMKILSESTGVRHETPSNPVPPPSPLANTPEFLQISQVTDPKMRAVALLKQAAKDGHSKAIERLAVAVQAHLNDNPELGSGPFDAVNNMIEKMIFHLMDEQKKEDEHKNWCDLELEKTETMKADKDDKIAELKSEIKVETAEVAKRNNEIEEANNMIASIVKFMKEATEVRETGKKENKAAIKDAQEAQTSLTNAIEVLETFYKSSGEIPKEPWEFVQKSGEPVGLPDKPSTWDAGYTGVTDPTKQPGGIIAVLEKVMGDFAQMESETKAQEAEDQKAYEEDMKANKIEKAGREKEVEMKTQEVARRNDKIASLNSQKKNVEAELEKTEQYLKDLKPACVDGDSDYETRKASRSKEIDALKEAQVILLDAFKEQEKEGGSKAFMQVKPHRQ